MVRVVLSVILFAAGFVFLSLTFLTVSSDVEAIENAEAMAPLQPEDLVEQLNQPVDVRALEAAGVAVEDADMLALFVLPLGDCPPVLTEVDRYAVLIQDYPSDGMSVSVHALVASENTASAERFVRLAKLPMPATSISSVSELFGEPVLTGGMQLVNIDLAAEKAVNRVLILGTSGLPEEATIEVLERALLMR